ncbi:MAG: 16S rRNA (guanine(966)-N(2))-methyltransferase RsmD [Rhizobiaceae bacterium]|nr:16S rRNA (guanine(966)-N(2))-methyltransferase RsmD [Rhizobiaceae bacterium]
MRIVAGKLRGRPLNSPKDQSIRPTTDRNREKLFNILTHRWAEQLNGNVLDMFAGTGALGLEALSRGANRCVFIEKGRQGASLIQQHIDSFGLAECARLLRLDATRPGLVDDWGPFDLVFADPPYGKQLADKALAGLSANRWLAGGAVLVVEEKKGMLPRLNDEFELLDQRDSGDTSMGIFQYVTG